MTMKLACSIGGLLFAATVVVGVYLAAVTARALGGPHS
jgi:hypothetical protein